MSKIRLLQLLILTTMIVAILNLTMSVHAYTMDSNNYSIVVYRGDYIKLSGKLQDANGLPIKNETLYFFDETNNKLIGKNITNSDGIAVFYWKIPFNYTPGLTLLNVTYKGNYEKYFLASTNKLEILILGKIKMTYFITDPYNENNDKVTLPNTFVKIDVTIMDENNNRLTNITVLLIDETNNVIANITTNEYGIGEIKFKTPSTEGIYQYTIIAYDENGRFTNATSKFKLTIEKTQPTLTVPRNFVAAINTTLKIIGQINLETNLSAIIDENLMDRFEIRILDLYNNCLACNYTTNYKFELNLFLDPEFFELGEYTLNVKLDETKYTYSVLLSIKISIKQKTMLVVLNNSTTFTKNRIITFNVKILDAERTPLENQEVCVKINDTLIAKGYSNRSGIATLTWFVDFDPGILEIRFDYPGNNTYYNTTIIVKCIILAETKIIITSPAPGSYFSYGEPIRIGMKILIHGIDNQIQLQVRVEVYKGPVLSTNIISVTNGSEIWCNVSLAYSQFNVDYIQALLNIVIEKNETEFVQGSTATLYIYVGKLIKSYLELSIDSINNSTSLTYKILCRLITFNNTPITNRPIKLFINSTLMGVNYTDKDGITSFLFTFDSKGVYNITLLFEGDNQFKSALKYSLLNVSQGHTNNTDESEHNKSNSLFDNLTIVGIAAIIITSSMLVLRKIKNRGIIQFSSKINTIVRYAKTCKIFFIIILVIMSTQFIAHSNIHHNDTIFPLFKNDVLAYISSYNITPTTVRVGSVFNLTIEYVLDYPDYGSGYVYVSLENSTGAIVASRITYERGHIIWNITMYIDPLCWSPGANNETGKITIKIFAEDGNSVYTDTKESYITVIRSNLEIFFYNEFNTTFEYGTTNNITFGFHNYYNKSIIISNYIVLLSIRDITSGNYIVFNKSKSAIDEKIIIDEISELNAGSYLIEIYFEGNNDYNPYKYNTTIVIYNRSTGLLVELLNNITYTYVEYDPSNSLINLIVDYFELLENGSELPLIGYSLEIISDFLEMEISNITINPYNLSLAAPSKSGTYSIKVVVYKKNYQLQEQTVNITVIKRPLIVYPVNTIEYIDVEQGNILEYIAKDLIANKTILSQVNISISYNLSDTIYTIFLGEISNGCISYNWTPPIQLILFDYVNISIAISTNNIYLEAINWTIYRIRRQLNVTLINMPSIAILNEPFLISIYVSFYNNSEMLHNFSIIVRDNDANVTLGVTKIDIDGLVNISIIFDSKLLEKGIRNLSIYLTNEDSPKVKLTEYQIEVWDRPQLYFTIEKVN
ncbi:MAG: hypothetical protein ACP6IU_07850 [Candidatus Asgardarchaeia archaeon]